MPLRSLGSVSCPTMGIVVALELLIFLRPDGEGAAERSPAMSRRPAALWRHGLGCGGHGGDDGAESTRPDSTCARWASSPSSVMDHGPRSRAETRLGRMEMCPGAGPGAAGSQHGPPGVGGVAVGAGVRPAARGGREGPSVVLSG